MTLREQLEQKMIEFVQVDTELKKIRAEKFENNEKTG